MTHLAKLLRDWHFSDFASNKRTLSWTRAHRTVGRFDALSSLVATQIRVHIDECSPEGIIHGFDALRRVVGASHVLAPVDVKTVALVVDVTVLCIVEGHLEPAGCKDQQQGALMHRRSFGCVLGPPPYVMSRNGVLFGSFRPFICLLVRSRQRFLPELRR